MGSPLSYAECIAECDVACQFPEVPGFPSQGYRAEGYPSGDYISCDTNCNSIYSSDVSNCLATSSSCYSGAVTPEDFEACASAECSCLGAADASKFSCVAECDRAWAYPEALAFAAAEVSEDEVCCNVELAGCYEPCELTYLTDMATIEDAWLTCIQARGGVGAQYDTDTASCNFFNSPDYGYCNAQRLISAKFIISANRICRAECEAIEMRREDLPNRKTKECASYEHVCLETCGGSAGEELTICSSAFYVCDDGCSDEACWQGCRDDYRECYNTVYVDQILCRKDCCKEEYESTLFGHARADAVAECFETRKDSDLACVTAWDHCVDACPDGDTGCTAGCKTTFCACDSAAQVAYEACQDLIPLRGDCPNCFSARIYDNVPVLPGEQPGSSGGDGPIGVASPGDCP